MLYPPLILRSRIGLMDNDYGQKYAQQKAEPLLTLPLSNKILRF